MHLSVDSTRSLAEVRDALPLALAAQGLAVASTHEIPAGGFVTELRDPLPDIVLSPEGGTRDRSTYKIATYARSGGGARLSTIRPTHLVELLDRPELAGPALILEKKLESALLAAAGRENKAPAL